MTTQTIEKAPLAGTGERRGPSEEMPEPVYPACKKLKAALSDYSSAEAELESYRAKAAKAELTQSEALEDDGLTEQEAAQRISHAQNLKAVYTGRAANLEKKSAGLFTELGCALVAASSELTHLVSTELEKRREIIVERLIAALGGIAEHAGSQDQQLLNLTRYSKPLNAVERLKPSPLYNAQKLPAADVIRTAESLLMDLETFKLEVGKKI
jgi:hypothetical protein